MTRRLFLSLPAAVTVSGGGSDGSWTFTLLKRASEESCSGQLIASGRLSSADHESADGWYAVNECAIHVHPDGIPSQILRDLRDQPVEIVIRRVERQLGKVER